VVGAGIVICLQQGADFHIAQLMPMPLTVSCFRKIQIGFTFLVPAHPDSPGQRAVKRVCVYISTDCTMLSTVLLLLCHMQHRQAVSVATLWWRKMKNVMLGLATQTTAATSSAS